MSYENKLCHSSNDDDTRSNNSNLNSVKANTISQDYELVFTRLRTYPSQRQIDLHVNVDQFLNQDDTNQQRHSYECLMKHITHDVELKEYNATNVCPCPQVTLPTFKFEDSLDFEEQSPPKENNIINTPILTKSNRIWCKRFNRFIKAKKAKKGSVGVYKPGMARCAMRKSKPLEHPQPAQELLQTRPKDDTFL